MKGERRTYPSRPKPPHNLPRPILGSHTRLKHYIARHHAVTAFLEYSATFNYGHEFLCVPDFALEARPELGLREDGGRAGGVDAGCVGEVEVYHFFLSFFFFFFSFTPRALGYSVVYLLRRYCCWNGWRSSCFDTFFSESGVGGRGNPINYEMLLWWKRRNNKTDDATTIYLQPPNSLLLTPHHHPRVAEVRR